MKRVTLLKLLPGYSEALDRALTGAKFPISFLCKDNEVVAFGDFEDVLGYDIEVDAFVQGLALHGVVLIEEDIDSLREATQDDPGIYLSVLDNEVEVEDVE